MLTIISAGGGILRSITLSFWTFLRSVGFKCRSKIKNTCLNRNSGCGLSTLAAEAAVLHSTCFLLKNCIVLDRAFVVSFKPQEFKFF